MDSKYKTYNRDQLYAVEYVLSQGYYKNGEECDKLIEELHHLRSLVERDDKIFDILE